jgi:tripartite-type tricarboxylate transporter receptor subunit TctC
MHAETVAVMESADMHKRLDEQGGVFIRMSPAEFGKLMAAETEKWMAVVKAANIREE